MQYPSRTLALSLALAAAIAVGSLAFSGVPAPAFSLGWLSGGACDDAEAQNPGDPAGCRYDARERDCADRVDNDSDEATDCLDPDCAGDPACGHGDPVCDNEAAANPGGTGGCYGSEPAHCQDGFDNDGDGLVDCADPDCANEPGCGGGGCDNPCDSTCANYNPCVCDPAGFGCGGCVDPCDPNGTCYDPSAPECERKSEICDNGEDDDGNGMTDCADEACWSECDSDTCDDSTACNYGEEGECTFCECDGQDNNGDGETDEDGEECSPGVTCVVISVSGINADASFDAAVQAEMNKSKGRATLSSFGGTENADATGASLEAELTSYYNNSNPNERILVVAHSLGAIATHNMRQTYGGSYSDTTFLLYDAPYNYPGSANPMRWFSGTLRAIARARESGVAGALQADWTGGYDDPGDAAEDQNHVKFSSDSSALTGIRDWVDGCPEK
jgi:hypothetical protein